MPKAVMEVDLVFLRDALHLPDTTEILACTLELHFNRITLLLEEGAFPDHEQGGPYPRVDAQFKMVEGKPTFVGWIKR